MDRPIATAVESAASNVEVVLKQATALWRAERDGQARPWLRGRRLGLLCDDAESADARLFRRAADELGAHVSHVKPTLTERTPAREVEATARLLGRLYDALECQGLSPAVVMQVRHAAGVPVFEGLATPQHPSAAWAGRLGDDVPPEAARCVVVEAVLVETLN
jgi:ornithine carbamoyltransferase